MTRFHSDPKIDEYFGWRSVSVSHAGKVRAVNEDSCFAKDEQAHWAVADGMGGHEAGDLASQMIVKHLQQLQQTGELADFIDKIEDSLNHVNSELFTLANERKTVIGSTVVGMIQNMAHMLLYWVGDSRGYLFRQGRLTQLTSDHTIVQEMLDKHKITAAEAISHPQKNVITRAIGTSKNLFVDNYMLPLEDGDIYLVCSDGIEKEVDDSALEDLFKSEKDINKLSPLILNTVLNKGARDNVSFVLVEPISLSLPDSK